jgi:hypothetical protein
VPLGIPPAKACWHPPRSPYKIPVDMARSITGQPRSPLAKRQHTMSANVVCCCNCSTGTCPACEALRMRRARIQTLFKTYDKIDKGYRRDRRLVKVQSALSALLLGVSVATIILYLV